MHLEKDIIKGKFGSNPNLKREAVDELKESKKGKLMAKALDKFIKKNKGAGKQTKYLKECDDCGSMRCKC